MSSPTRTSVGSGRVGRAVEYLQELWRRREFALALGLGNLKARNASTSLGLVWWVLNPILLGAVYFLVFGLLFAGRRPDDFLTYLLAGMFAFHFTSQSMTGGANSIIQNSKLLANLRFPRLILPISTLIESLVGFLTSLVVLFAVAFVSGVVLDHQYFTPQILLLPLVIFLHLIFNLGLGTITARLAVPFRDINNLLPYINRIWLYLTPVIWPLSFLDQVNEGVQRLIRLNPMFDIVGLYRTAIMGYPFDSDMLVGAVVWSVVVGVVGVASFVKYEGHMVRYL
jgi:teichoic acid transport system permease protein